MDAAAPPPTAAQVVPPPESPFTARRVKVFVATGYNDGSGVPSQAVATCAAAEQELHAWQFVHRNAEVTDVVAAVDSRQHGKDDWNGACVTTQTLHYVDHAASLPPPQLTRAQRRAKAFVGCAYNDGSGNPKAAVAATAEAQAACDAWVAAQTTSVDIVAYDVVVDSKPHGNTQWYGACVTTIVCHYYTLREPAVPPRLPARGQRRVQTFVSTGYNDGSGVPTQAKTTVAAAETAAGAWLDAHANIDVLRIDVVVDSKNHGLDTWNGACVTTYAVHYFDAADALAAPRPFFVGALLVKTFVGVGYNDTSGDPKQATVCTAAAQKDFDVWLAAESNGVEVVDVAVKVNSGRHGNSAWCGACVTTVTVKYRERLFQRGNVNVHHV
jgi:hypothetical protein